MKLELIATATFGLEAVVKRELENLGFKALKSEDAKITFSGDERAIVKSNLWLRCADRVQLKMGEFDALEFEGLFQRTKALPWEEWIPPDGKFPVSGTSVKSKLRSVPACQSIVKKAIVEKLKDVYCVPHFEESGAEYPVKVTILKDRATLTIDTSGAGLHKRGYRLKDVRAPIKETLAASLVSLTFWREGRLLVDPCCGSGTIPIEAALMGRNIAPGLGRRFISEGWDNIPERIWKEERKSAFEAINHDADIKILAYDIDPRAIAISKENAEQAGVDDCISFDVADISRFTPKEGKGIMILNPPYGERVGEDKEIRKIYGGLKKIAAGDPTWSFFVITSDKNFENAVFGRPADRRRKLYNGRIETCYYQFHGKKEE